MRGREKGKRRRNNKNI
uniref:Uncharacterized protein n=1 Tax=Wuchereria bancrofti TaxID=6293 RepID=A0AAF5Q4L1_WUCBA